MDIPHSSSALNLGSSQLSKSTEVIDLLHQLQDVSIECNTPAYDGHEAKNLLQPNCVKGFLAERFIKPPVTVTLKFPCTIHLKSIFIDAAVGCSNSTGFEIMSYALNKNRTPEKLPVFKPIGRVWSLSSTKIEFVNHRFSSSQNTELSSAADPSIQQCRLSSHDHSLMNSARYLSITITQTAGGKVPAIKQLKVFGRPSLPQFIKVNQTPAALISSHHEPIYLHSLQDQSAETLEPVDSSVQQIPPEFLDALTNEIMSLPIILPSGHTIDQSSLDKHIDLELTWGRKPSDPFTGVLFTQRRKPVVDQRLKERIDHYILVSNLNAPRTLGIKRPNPDHTNNINPTSNNTTDTSDYAHSSKKLKRQKPEPDLCFNNELSTPDNTESSNGSGGVTLAQRLNKLLKKSSKYRVVTLPDDKVLVECSHCSSAEPQYKLACEHLLCRSCATATNTHVCSVCSTSTASNLITKYHPPSLV